MKSSKYIFLLLMVVAMLGAAGCKSKSGKNGKPAANKELPAAVAEAYREDAARLAVRELLTSTQTGEKAADIPPDRIAYFYDLLSKIYWLAAKDDSIPDLSGIHTLKTPNLKQVMVVLDKKSEFKENWSKGVTMTGNLYLNQLISRYKLSIKNYREGALGPTLIMESPAFINTPELAFLFKNIETIKHAEAEGMAGDGNNIEWGSDSKNATALKYSVGAGDCPSGCIHRKYWIFYIATDGTISYMGTRGEVPAENDLK